MSVKYWKAATQTAENITKGGNIISLTRAEYEALETKNPNILYVITDDEQGAQEGVYSQSETICGTWIDGKPIYRKVLSGDSKLANETIATVDNIEHIIDVKGFATTQNDNDLEVILNTYVNNSWCSIALKKSQMAIVNSSNQTIKNYSVVIEYTKTTD